MYKRERLLFKMKIDPRGAAQLKLIDSKRLPSSGHYIL